MSIISNKGISTRGDRISVPLYDYLALEAQLQEVNLQELSIKLSQLSPEHASVVQILILHHSSIKGNNRAAIPYGGLMLTKNSGIRYGDLTDLPRELVQIIANYLDKAERLNN